MQITVTVEALNGAGFRARGWDPYGIAIEAPTREEALRKYRETILQKLAQMGEVLQLDIGEPSRPWLKYAGTWAEDDPVIDEWLDCIKENRRRDDADPSVL
jgi:hypothetical protein